MISPKSKDMFANGATAPKDAGPKDSEPKPKVDFQFISTLFTGLIVGGPLLTTQALFTVNSTKNLRLWRARVFHQDFRHD